MTSQPATTNPQWAVVDKYTVKHLHPTSTSGTAELPSNEILAATVENNDKNGLPDIAVSPPQGKFLQLQARLLRARSILEVGTLGAFSTLWLATATPETRVVSLEVNEAHATVARENLARAGLLLSSPPSSSSPGKGGAEVRVGAALDSLPAIEAEVLVAKTRAPFDLVFIDADKENNWAYVDKAANLSRSGALIVVDNVVRGGRLADLSDLDSRVLGARQVVENVGKDGRFEATVLQLVGEKGYDGFLLIYVK